MRGCELREEAQQEVRERGELRQLFAGEHQPELFFQLIVVGACNDHAVAKRAALVR